MTLSLNVSTQWPTSPILMYVCIYRQFGQALILMYRQFGQVIFFHISIGNLGKLFFFKDSVICIHDAVHER
jgi:hypothetical protein